MADHYTHFERDRVTRKWGKIERGEGKGGARESEDNILISEMPSRLYTVGRSSLATGACRIYIVNTF